MQLRRKKTGFNKLLQLTTTVITFHDNSIHYSLPKCPISKFHDNFNSTLLKSTTGIAIYENSFDSCYKQTLQLTAIFLQFTTGITFLHNFIISYDRDRFYKTKSYQILV